VRFRPPLKQDLGGCPEGTTAGKGETLSFRGPFRFVAPCLEKSGRGWKSRWCLIFLTGTQIIITPVPASLQANLDRRSPPARPHRAQATWPGFFGNRDATAMQRLDELAEEYSGGDPEKVFFAGPDAHSISLDRIREIVITWVRSPGHYSRLLFPFGMYPAEPGNAGYRADYQLTVVTGEMKIIVVTPFSIELKQALRDLLGERVREVPDRYAPIL
jgi:hypothetical protein